MVLWLCFIIIKVLLRFFIFLSELISFLLFFWCKLIFGLFKIYNIFESFELIWVVNWICCVLLFERVVVLCVRFR